MDPSGDADKDFAMMMVPHHEGAIDMAKLELQHGKDPQLRAMAEKIIAAQEAEIAELKKWQQEKGMQNDCRTVEAEQGVNILRAFSPNLHFAQGKVGLWRPRQDSNLRPSV